MTTVVYAEPGTEPEWPIIPVGVWVFYGMTYDGRGRYEFAVVRQCDTRLALLDQWAAKEDAT